MRRLLPALLVGTLLAPASAVAARYGMPEPLTRHGEVIESIYVQVFIAGLAVFLVVMAMMAWVLWRYREGTGQGRPTHEKHRHSMAAEASWTVIPLVLVMWIGWIAYVGLVELDGPTTDEVDMELEIHASQYNWQAVYPAGFSVFASPDGKDGSVLEENYFIVPAGKDILLNITSGDVIHALHIMDANRMSVALADANPGGDHVYNHKVVNFPPGEYPVQCREMCFNPGHAYMRAHFRAVPAAEYDQWASQKEMCIGVQVCVQQDLALGRAGLSDATPVVGVQGARYVVRFSNELERGVQVQAGAAARLPVGPGATVLVAMDLPSLGNHTFQVLDTSGVVASRIYQAVDATPYEVVLGDFEFEPEPIHLEAGVRYAITLDNRHQVPHNLYIGHHPGQVLAKSVDVPAGQSATMIVTMEQSGTYDIWCNIAGHYELGMHGHAQVS